LVFTAAETIPDLERRIEQQENFLSTLLGNNPVDHTWNEVNRQRMRLKFRQVYPPAS